MLFYFWFSISISICICITKIINQKTKKQKTNNRYSSLIRNLKQCKQWVILLKNDNTEKLVETKTRIKNVRWNGSDWNCKSIWHPIQFKLLLLFQKIWKVNFIHFFFFSNNLFFFCLCSFISFWFWFSNKNLTNKINNRHSKFEIH